MTGVKVSCVNKTWSSLSVPITDLWSTVMLVCFVQCPIEWFHYGCVGLTQAPRGKWYCPQCLAAMKRRGRKWWMTDTLDSLDVGKDTSIISVAPQRCIKSNPSLSSGVWCTREEWLKTQNLDSLNVLPYHYVKLCYSGRHTRWLVAIAYRLWQIFYTYIHYKFLTREKSVEKAGLMRNVS